MSNFWSHKSRFSCNMQWPTQGKTWGPASGSQPGSLLIRYPSCSIKHLAWGMLNKCVWNFPYTNLSSTQMFWFKSNVRCSTHWGCHKTLWNTCYNSDFLGPLSFWFSRFWSGPQKCVFHQAFLTNLSSGKFGQHYFYANASFIKATPVLAKHYRPRLKLRHQMDFAGGWGWGGGGVRWL